MIIVYAITMLYHGDGSIYSEKSRAILRFYDEGEAPENLQERAVVWANALKCAIEVLHIDGDQGERQTFYPESKE